MTIEQSCDRPTVKDEVMDEVISIPLLGRTQVCPPGGCHALRDDHHIGAVRDVFTDSMRTELIRKPLKVLSSPHTCT